MTEPHRPLAETGPTVGPFAVASASTSCESCGTPQARMWSTPQGAARLCPPCATLHGIGCP